MCVWVVRVGVGCVWAVCVVCVCVVCMCGVCLIVCVCGVCVGCVCMCVVCLIVWCRLRPQLCCIATEHMNTLCTVQCNSTVSGGIIVTGLSQSTRIKSCRIATPSTTNPAWIDLGSNPCFRGETPATSCRHHVWGSEGLRVLTLALGAGEWFS